MTDLVNRFTQLITFLTSSVFCILYATSDELRSPITFGPIRYVLPENVTKDHSMDVLNSELIVVLNDLTIYDSNDQPLSQHINLVVFDASPLEIDNPLINQTAESNPSLIPYLYDPDDPVRFFEILYFIGQNKPWYLPQDWLISANEKYKQIDERTLKSGQKAYVFEKTDFDINDEAFQMYHIVSKLEEASMSRLLHLHTDELGLDKALELANSLEYSKTGFEQEDQSIENQAVSKIDDLISNPIELDARQEDGPFSVQFAKDRKFKIIHPYAEVGPNVYGEYESINFFAPGLVFPMRTQYNIFAHYVKTSSEDGASMITEDFDKYFQKKGGERFKTTKMKDGFLIKNSENFEIHLDLSDPDWKEKFTDSDHQPWLHLSIKGPEQDLDHALSVVNSANFSSAINPQKIILSDFLPETTSPAPIKELENLDQEFPPSPENVELESEDLYEFLRTSREYDKIMIPTTWNWLVWLNKHWRPLDIPVFSDKVVMQESKFTDDAVSYSKLLYSNLEQRASYQAWVVQNENDIPPTDMVVEKFKTESGFCGVSIHSESMNYYYILLDITTDERRNDWASLGNQNPESVWFLWEFPYLSDKEEFEIYRAIVNTYQNRKSQQPLPCPPSEESLSVQEQVKNENQFDNQNCTSETNQKTNPTSPAQKTKSFTENLELTSLGSNWYNSNWFGTFFETENQWIYHTDMGWTYAVPIGSSPESVWAWKEGIGWLWSSESTFPYLYSDTSKFWIYLKSEDIEQSKYYDYFDEQWRDWGDFPTRTIVEIEGRSIERILQSDQSSAKIADEIMSILMRGL